MQIAHVNGNREKRLLFRGWSRICLHASSLSAAEGASVVVAAAARADRAEALERQAAAATEVAEKTEKVVKRDMGLKEIEQRRRRAKCVVRSWHILPYCGGLRLGDEARTLVDSAFGRVMR